MIGRGKNRKTVYMELGGRGREKGKAKRVEFGLGMVGDWTRWRGEATYVRRGVRGCG